MPTEVAKVTIKGIMMMQRTMLVAKCVKTTQIASKETMKTYGDKPIIGLIIMEMVSLMPNSGLFMQEETTITNAVIKTIFHGVATSGLVIGFPFAIFIFKVTNKTAVAIPKTVNLLSNA